jgi:alpha-L-fucosidase
LPCCRKDNLAYKGAVQASSEESDRGNFVAHATDGDLATRWCAQDGASGEWLQIDLGNTKHVRALRIHWERLMNYRYTVEASADGKSWRQIVEDPGDEHIGENRDASPEHLVNSPNTRFLRIEMLDGGGFWASIREVEVSEGKLPAPPTEQWDHIKPSTFGEFGGDIFGVDSTANESVSP